MTDEELKYAIERIEHLEKIFDEARSEFKTNPDFDKNEDFERKINLLTQYLESGQWMRDFRLDEKGELPNGLKRGILSEDGLYNLLSDIEEAKRKKTNPFNRILDKIKSVFK